MGSVCVFRRVDVVCLLCVCCVFVVNPLTILSAVFCVICSLLMFVVTIWWKCTRVWVLLWVVCGEDRFLLFPPWCLCECFEYLYCSSCVLYSVGSDVKRVHVVLSGLRMSLFV